MEAQKITCEIAKKMDAKIVAEKLGMRMAKEKRNEVWFFYKNEKKASLKIDTRINKWYNHSEGYGGNTLDLVIYILKCTISEALIFLSDNTNTFSFHQQTKIDLQTEKKYTIMGVKLLQHKVLIDYLISRKIDEKIAIKYCREIHYKLNSKKYFAIAFENDKNGFEIRNKYIKGNLVNKEISTIENGSSKVAIFEGFIDFLSFKTFYKTKSFQMDYIILNSISNVKNIIPKIKNYKKVLCFLDNDKAGKNGTKILLKNHKVSMDFSFIYQGYKDFNEYLMERQE